MTAPRESDARWASLAPPLLLFAAAAALYTPALGNQLTNWDDDRYVVHNPIAARGLAGVAGAFTTGFDDAWYPLTQTAYCLLHAAWGAEPLPYHALQVLLFALAAALLPFALEAFGVPRRAGALAALLWLAHPMRVESVAWAAGLKDALSLSFAVAAFALRGRRRRWASAGCFALALLAKTTVFPLALLFVALEWRDRSPAPGGASRALARGALWVVPAVACAVVTASLHLGGATAPFRTQPGGSLAAAVPSVLWLPWQYLGATLAPRHPQAAYAFAPVRWTDARLLAAVGLWAALAAFVATRRTRRPAWALGVAAWWLPFAPVTGLVPLAFHVADRYALLPSIAVCAGAALALEALGRAARWPRAPIAVAAGLAAALAVAASSRVREWYDGISLWEADRSRAPELPVVRYDLAGAYGGAGRWDDAIAELQALRKLTPSELAPLSALVFAWQGRAGAPPARVLEVRAALERGKKDPATLLAVAEQLLEDGNPQAALAIAEALGAWAPGARAETLTARAALAIGRFDEALRHARAARLLDPSDEWPRVPEALALLRLGRVEEARRVAAPEAADVRVEAQLIRARAWAAQGTVP